MPRPVTTLDKSIYIHQFNYGTAGAGWPAIVARCKAAGANIIKLKAIDGTHWMGDYDLVTVTALNGTAGRNNSRRTAPNAVTSAWQWSQLAGEAARQGVQLVPWCVPHGEDLAGELAILDELANYSGKLIELDIEPYAGFWLSTPARLLQLIGELYERAITVWVDCDIRPYAASELPLADMAPFVSRWLSQSYWTTFQASATATVEHDADLFAGLPSGDWGAILPAAGASDFQAAAELAASRDAAEIGFWSYNVAGQPALDAFGRIG